MLSQFSPFSNSLGGLEFYGYSDEFKDLIQLCREFASPLPEQSGESRKAYLFIEPYHGKSSMARAVDFEAKNNKLSSYYLDGSAGPSQKRLLDIQHETDSLALVDGVPENAVHRRTLLERFNSFAGRALLFASPQYVADAALDANIPKLRLPHVDQRPVDKLAWLVGIVRERLRDDNGFIPATLSEGLARLPVKALLSLSNVELGSRISDLHHLANRIAEALQLRLEVDPEQPLLHEELAVIFIDFYSPRTRPSDHGFRLWVEGDSDSRLLKLVSRLVSAATGANLEEGLSILPLGIGREGGTSRVTEIVKNEETRKNKDVFLFDFDDSGRTAKEELRILEQDVVLLDPRLSCSRSDADVEVEDFISLSCLDRFYTVHTALRPEKEIIRYKPPATRRIVVEGEHKEQLIVWLESNASLAELDNLFFVLCECRSQVLD